MATLRATGVLIVVLLLSAHAYAQDATASEPSALPPPAEIPPPPPGDVSATQVPEPPATYAAAPVASTAPAPPPSSNLDPRRAPSTRRLFNIWLGLGIGDALGCGNEDPDSPCAVDFAGTFAHGADYRFVSRFSVGLELGLWSFAVPDEWRGKLPGQPDKADLSLAYLAVFGRWYWFAQGMLDPYVQLGLGLGTLTANVSNATDSFRYTASGVVPHLGVGMDFHVGEWFRLGPQLLAAFLRGNRICEQVNEGAEVCRDPEKNDKGEQEGNALAWRFMLVGTVMLGRR